VQRNRCVSTINLYDHLFSHLFLQELAHPFSFQLNTSSTEPRTNRKRTANGFPQFAYQYSGILTSFVPTTAAFKMVLLSTFLGTWLAIVTTTTAAPAGTCNAPKPPPTSEPGYSTPTPGHERTGIPMPDDFHRLQRIYQKNVRASLPSGNCTKSNIGKRRSWYVPKSQDSTEAMLTENSCLGMNLTMQPVSITSAL
jgi:hypothetical protein